MQHLDPKIPVAVLGATGSVGQRFIALLANHPWFEIAALTASERSAGRPYGEAVQWMQETPLPAHIAAMEVLPTQPPLPCRLVFSALDTATAGAIEGPMADAGHFVVSNASSHRMDPDVPLMVPEVNPEHLDLVRHQTWENGGALVTNPNCSTIGLVLALKPLVDTFGLEQVHVVTMQALSGAGVPGVSSMAAIDNLVPYIGNEEDKLETEPAKILGRLEGDRIATSDLTLSAQCNRVAVLDGHTECVSVLLARRASRQEVSDAFSNFTSLPQELRLPSAPRQPIHVTTQADRPQPRLDRNRDGGMAVTVGRLRPCPLFDYKFVALSHNTLRGAAGGSILVAELAVVRGLVPGVDPIPTLEEGREEH